MRVTTQKIKRLTTDVVVFDSINEFNKYINTTKDNTAFLGWSKSSQEVAYEGYWYGTETYEQAIGYLVNGWDEGAKDITTKLKAAKLSTKFTEVKRKLTNDVVGFQASVPRYLQGIPTNMYNTKISVQKKRVITINKDISYSGAVSEQAILESSLQTLLLVEQLEHSGVRVNLNVILGTECDNTGFVIKVKIKSSGERLNISKMAFPLVHPSFLRRLMFKFIEVYPNITKGFRYGYGHPQSVEVLEAVSNGEWLAPKLLGKDSADIALKELTSK